MKTFIKRVVAYLIDIILVSLISTFITSNSYINKDYKIYNDTYEKYIEISNEYENNILELEEQLNDEEIDEDTYNTEIEKLNEEYSENNINYNYKLLKYSIVPTIISILLILLYFVVIQFYFNGQTLGKKIMKIQIKSNSGKNLTIFNYLLRSLIINEVLINVISVICLFILSKSNYLIYNQIIYIITYVLEITIISMMMFDKNHRGLHDYIANTKVVDLKEGRDVNEM